jgi:polar amino acid transport system permease protein
MYTWNWDILLDYKGQLIDAALLTLWLNIAVLIFGTLLGIVLGLLKRVKLQILRYFIISFIDLFRTLPVLVLLIWFNYCVPILFHINWDSLTTAIIVLSLNLAAFIAEIVDAGVQGVPAIHVESGKVLGFSKMQNMRYIVLPIAIRLMIPPIVGQYINSIKLSVLASMIAVPELLNVTQNIISQTYRPLEFYTALAVLFLILLLPGTILSKKFEMKSSQNENNKSSIRL